MLRLLKLLTIAYLASVATVHADGWQVDSANRVVAIADIHGAYSAMVETLQNAGVIGEQLGWTGGATHLVVVGDILDRGPRSRDTMDLLMRLEVEATAAGGRVHVLIGNHESMNLIGDLRYVSKEEYAAFAADESQEERDRWFQAYVERNGAEGAPETLREGFEREYPAGFFALRRAFEPDSHYGKWLLEKPVIAVVNGTAFVHGGLSPLVEKIGLDGVNRDLKQELVRYVRAMQVLIDAEVLLPTDSYYDTLSILKSWMPALDEEAGIIEAVETVRTLFDSDLFFPDGPLWYRSNVTCGGLIEEHRVEAALAAIGADRVVVGHTPTLNRQVMQRFDGQLIEIDTGMLNSYYKGSGNALVLEGEAVTVVRQSGASRVTPIEHPRRVGARPGLLSSDELQALLETGGIISNEVDAMGRTVVQVGDGKRSVSALFAPRKSRGFYPGVAAYRLDRMLELDMVPVTVRRNVNGKDGSLQFITARYSDEARRSASGRGGDASCSLPDQWGAMYVFDVLIYNEGRTQQRMLYDIGSWQLMLSEHDRAFGARKGRPRHLEDVPLDINAGWREALTGLTDEMLEAGLSDVLDKRRIKSLAKRRDELLATAEPVASR